MFFAEGEKFFPPDKPGFILIGIRFDFYIVEKLSAGQEACMKNSRVDDCNSSFMEIFHEVKQFFRVTVYSHAVGNHNPVEIHLVRYHPDSKPVFGADTKGLDFSFRFQDRQGLVSLAYIPEQSFKIIV